MSEQQTPPVEGQQQQSSTPQPDGQNSNGQQSQNQQVPYDRFREVNEQLKELRKANEELAKFKQEAENAKLSEAERTQKALQEAEERAKTAEERAVKAEVRARLRARAASKVASPDALVDLSEAKLIELAEASDEKLDKHIEQLRDKYSLPANGQQPQGPTPIGGLTAPAAPSGEIPKGEDGKPDVKAGLGRDLLAALTGQGR